MPIVIEAEPQLTGERVLLGFLGPDQVMSLRDYTLSEPRVFAVYCHIQDIRGEFYRFEAPQAGSMEPDLRDNWWGQTDLIRNQNYGVRYRDKIISIFEHSSCTIKTSSGELAKLIFTHVEVNQTV